MLIAPKLAPRRTNVVVFAVQFGRVPLIPEINVSAPVPFERLPRRLRLPVPAVEPFAACKLSAPAAPVASARVALMTRSRNATTVTLPELVMSRLTVKSLKP